MTSQQILEATQRLIETGGLRSQSGHDLQGVQTQRRSLADLGAQKLSEIQSRHSADATGQKFGSEKSRNHCVGGNPLFGEVNSAWRDAVGRSAALVAPSASDARR